MPVWMPQCQEPAPDAGPAFWRGFNDPELTKLVELALRHNHDVQLALANYQQANAMLGSVIRLFAHAQRQLAGKQ